MGRSRCAEAGLSTGVFTVAGLKILTTLLLKKNLTQEGLRKSFVYWSYSGMAREYQLD